MKLEVNPDDIQTVDADSRGRVYLGTEFADVEGIEIAILNEPRDE